MNEQKNAVLRLLKDEPIAMKDSRMTNFQKELQYLHFHDFIRACVFNDLVAWKISQSGLSYLNNEEQ